MGCAPSRSNGVVEVVAQPGDKHVLHGLNFENNNQHFIPDDEKKSTSGASNGSGKQPQVESQGPKLAIPAEPVGDAVISPRAAASRPGSRPGSGQNTPPSVGAEEHMFSSTLLEQISHSDLRFVRVVGEGTYKRVWVGELRSLKKWVAIAEFKETGGIEKEEYKKECAIAMQLPAHPNVVKILGTAMDGETLYMVYEYVKRGSLFKLLYKDRMKMDPKTKWTIITGIARGLSFLHANKIAHRDMKSDNILISADFTARITDFGMSKKRAGADDSDETMATTMCGTAMWLPPEIMKNLAYNRFAADIYSCALVIFEVMSGKLPYAHVRNEAELVRWVGVQNKRPPFSPEGDDVEKNVQLQSAVASMWVTDPKNRPRFPELFAIICEGCPHPECVAEPDFPRTRAPSLS